MTPAEIKNYLESEESRGKLLVNCKSQFDLIDQWQKELEAGDILTEYEISDAMEKLTAVYVKFHPIAEVIKSAKTNRELNHKEAYFEECEINSKKPNVSQVNERARANTEVRALRELRNIFESYAEACEKVIGSCQSRLKNLTKEKAQKMVDCS